LQIYIIIFILGTVIGSFFNVCIYRLPRYYSIKSLIWSRSFCPNCLSKIKLRDNIPIISFWVLGGRCRICKYPIPLRYLIVELITPIVFMLIYYKFRFEIMFLVLFLFFASLLIIIAFIDMELFVIPDKLTYPGIIIGILSCWIANNIRFQEVILGGIILGSIIYLLNLLSLVILKKEGMGGGDVTLAALIGVYLGYKLGLIALIIGAMIASFVNLFFILLKKRNWGEYIALGPYLSLGALITLISFKGYIF